MDNSAQNQNQAQAQDQVDIYKHFYDTTCKEPRQAAKLALWNALYGASPETIKRALGVK